MAVTWTGTGGIFTRLGEFLGSLRNLNGVTGTAAPNPSSTWGSSGTPIKNITAMYDTLLAQFASNEQAVVDGIYTEKAALISALAGTKFAFVNRATNTIIQQVNRDSPLPSLTIQAAMTKLISEMVTASQSVQKNTVSISTTAGGSNIGNAICATSIVGKAGVNLEQTYNETLTAVVTTDRNTGATAGSETLRVSGAQAAVSLLDPSWPLGSGSSATLTVIDPTKYQTGNLNLLNNGDFASFTANVPNQWTVQTGTAGTTFQDGTSSAYVGSHCAEFLGNGSELTAIVQPFSNSSGSTAVIKASTVYAFNFWVKVSATPTAGVLAAELIDGGNNIIANDAGTNNQVTLTLSGISTTYVKFSGFFQTPTNLPSTVQLRLRLSTALDNAKNCFVSYGGLTPATQFYTGGPYAAIFRGNTDLVLNDTFAIAAVNNYGGLMQTGFWQAFNMPSLGFVLPSSASPTIADSLVA